MFRLKFYALMFALVIGLLTAFSQTARAATLTVTNTADAGAGSLRAAITSADANPDPDTIVFESPLFDTAQTINLARRLTISSDLTITGRGARLLTVRRASSTDFRIFVITAGTIAISGLTISNGSSGNGGGISNDGTLTLTDVAVSGNNSLTSGGGIYSSGTTNILNSTISGNTTKDFGGGINVNAGTVNITNSTVSGNSSGASVGGAGGGIDSNGTLNLTNVTITNNSTNSGASGVFVRGGTVTIKNTIIAADSNNTTNPDVSGAFTSQGYNLIGNPGSATGFVASDQLGNPTTPLDPKLDPTLQLNGGTTPNHALLLGSPAIDKGFSFGLTTDQRGFTRPFDNPSITNAGDGADIGAFEVQAAPTAASVTVSGRVLTPNGRGLMNAIVVLTDLNGSTRTARTGTFGYYRFDEVEAGQTYIFNVSSKRYSFAPQVVNVTEDLTEQNFTAQNWLRILPKE